MSDIKTLEARISRIRYEVRLRSDIHGPLSESCQTKRAELKEAQEQHKKMKWAAAVLSGKTVLA